MANPYDEVANSVVRLALRSAVVVALAATVLAIWLMR
jgi:hypothetical protein